MSDAAPPLFEAVREACSPRVWSRGVELTRAGVVVAERTDESELVFRVTTPGGIFSPRVVLFPGDLEWECECPGREPVCEHVAAATIAWRNSLRGGDDVRVLETVAGRVGYRFRRGPGGLALSRVIVDPQGDAEALETTLAAATAAPAGRQRFVATHQDLEVELALGTHRRGLLPAPLVPKLFAKLARCEDVRLDGVPVAVSPEPLLPRARVEDQGEGFRLVVEQDSTVTETFANGIALAGDALRVIGAPRLTGRERHELGPGRHFDSRQVAELVTEVLPSLRRRIPVDVATERLPETAVEKPRAVLDVRREGTTLSVLGTIVYGDPPTARIDAGRLVHLQGPVPLRNLESERRAVHRLERLGLAPGVRAFFSGEEAVAFNARLDAWEQPIPGEARRYFRLAPPLVPRFHVEGSDFELSFESAAGSGSSAAGRGADAREVLAAWGRGDSLVPLEGGGFAPLPADWLSRFGHRVADLLAARDAAGRLPRACLSDLAGLCEDLDQPPPPELAELRRRLSGFDGIPAAVLPGDLATPPRVYQRQGADWLVFLREAGLGAMLADDMGLGKTLQALCALRGRTLVIAPTSVLHNWQDEIRRHRPGLTCSVYHGVGRGIDSRADVTLTTYALLRLDADRLAAERWDTVVLDEAQNIKNPDSQVAAAAFRLDAAFRIVLTGTPVENRLEELWSQFHFINRGLLGGRRDFDLRYSEPIARGDEGAAARLRSRIRPFVLRRLKREVAAELPPRTEMVLYCELSPEERELYDTIRAAALGEVVRKLDAGASVLAALEALLRLRQAACHPGLIPGRHAPGSSKVDLLLEALASVVADGHRALVFSQWTSLLDLVQPHLEAASIDYLRLDGSTRDRADVVRRFQDDGGPPLLLISLRAGGTGLNLTAADHVFLLDPWWNPAVEDQAADRAHRIGQEKPVMIYRLVAEGTVEERIQELKRAKRELAEVALGGSGRAAGLTREDLIELLS